MLKTIKCTAAIVSLVILFGVQNSFAQDIFNRFGTEGLIRVAEPGQLADTLNLWGDIQNPGRYLVPRNTSLPDLISYARGPLILNAEDTKVKKVSIFVLRYAPTTGRETIKEFSFKPDEPLPAGIRNYPLNNDDIVTLKVKRKGTFFRGVRNVAPILTLIITGLLAYDRLSRGR